MSARTVFTLTAILLMIAASITAFYKRSPVAGLASAAAACWMLAGSDITA